MYKTNTWTIWSSQALFPGWYTLQEMHIKHLVFILKHFSISLLKLSQFYALWQKLSEKYITANRPNFKFNLNPNQCSIYFTHKTRDILHCIHVNFTYNKHYFRTNYTTNTIKKINNHQQTTQNYWVFGLCPLYGILKTREHNISKTECFHPQVRGRHPLCQIP
jgi:hypothetical protein